MKLKQVKAQSDVQSLKQDFDRWRSIRIRGESIPEQLWESAVVLAQKYPPNHIAKTMSLDTRQLKKRMGLSDTSKATIRVAPVNLAEPKIVTKSLGHSLIAELTTTHGTHVRIYSSIDPTGMQALASLLREA